jgi:hypothetical protein
MLLSSGRLASSARNTDNHERQDEQQGLFWMLDKGDTQRMTKGLGRRSSGPFAIDDGLR